MYYPIIRQCVQALKNLETWLDKAEQHAAAKGFDVGVLLTSRLAPDMKDFIYQIQSACDYTKGAAAWLSGQKPPGTRTASRRSTRFAPAFARPSISRRALRKHSMRAPASAGLASPGGRAR